MVQKLSEQVFAQDLREHGIHIAERNRKKRQIYDYTLKQHAPEVCRHCSTTLFCHACSHGSWLFTD